MLVVVLTGPHHRTFVDVPVANIMDARNAAFRHVMNRRPNDLPELLTGTIVPVVDLLTAPQANTLLSSNFT
jgi:hypothetical protein